MMFLSSQSRLAAFGVIATGALIGGFQQICQSSFGATLESSLLPWCAWLVGVAIHRGSVRAPAMFRSQSARWVATSFTTTAALFGGWLTDQLAGAIGATSLPRAALPVLWTSLAACTFAAPMTVKTPAPAWGGALLAASYLFGFLAPSPLVAMVVGLGCAIGAAATSSRHPPENPGLEESEPPASLGWLDRSVVTFAAVGIGFLGIHVFSVFQPVLDPTPAVVVGATLGVLGSATLVWGRSTFSPWWCLMSVGLMAAVAALLMPHVVGVGRLVHTTSFTYLDPSWSPSVAAGLAALVVGSAFGPVGTMVARSGRRELWPPLGAALGLVMGLGPVDPEGQLAVTLAAIAAALALLLASARPVQGAALLLASFLAGVVWRGTDIPVDIIALSPVSGFRSADAWTNHLDRAIDYVPGNTQVGGHGVGTVLASPEDWRAAGTTSVLLPFQADVSGRISLPNGRKAEAEVMAGLIAAMLAPRLDRVLVLNDDVGSVLAGLSPAAPSTVDIATPVPGVVQSVANLVPLRRERWLQPGVRLWPEHPASVLRRAPAPAAVVDVVHGSWRDGSHTAPTADHFAAVHRSLGDFGVYVLCVHLDNFGTGVPAQLALAVAEEFEHTQLWLPPSGADSMLLVASGRPLPLSRLETRAEEHLSTVRSLGFPNAAALATMAVGGTPNVRDWQARRSHIEPSWMLSPGVRGSIPLHLASFAPHIGRVEDIWDMTDSGMGAPDLAGRLDARRRFLELLDDAAHGNVAEALDKARGLADEDGGEQALRALVGPHLDNARKALATAAKEGPSSGAWADVQRFATTARMIAPTSPEPLIILGTTSLARADLSGAQKHFAEANRLASGNLEALSGLARVSLLRRDRLAAEQYLQEAATANPRQWLAWHRLGVFLTEAKRFDEAEKVLKRSVGLAEGASPAPTLALARLYLLTDRPTAALVHAEGGIVMGAKDEAYFLRGLAYRDLEQLDNAEKDFRQAVLYNPKHTSAHGEIGRIRATKGDNAAAEEAWKSVLRIDPNNSSARENLRRLGVEERAAGPTSAQGPVSPAAGTP